MVRVWSQRSALCKRASVFDDDRRLAMEIPAFRPRDREAGMFYCQGVKNMKSRSLVVVGVMLFLAVAMGLSLSSATVPARAAAPGFPLSVTDQTGHQITIPTRPERIISLTPNNTEILFAIGAGEQVVGVGTYDDYPPEVKNKQRIGDLKLDYEKIIGLRPDLIVANETMQPGDIKRLRDLGLNVFSLAPTNLETTLDAILLAGKATGHTAEAEKLVRTLSDRIAKVDAAAKKLTSKRPKVFVEIWNEPLMTAGPGSFLDELIIRAGGENVAHDASGAWPQFSLEELIARDPDIIILTNYNKAEVLKRAAWQRITAVRAKRVYEVDPAIYTRPGPRLVDGLEQLQELLFQARQH